MNIAESDCVLDLGIGTGVSLNYYPGTRASSAWICRPGCCARRARRSGSEA
jgi:hypothetical protein